MALEARDNCLKRRLDRSITLIVAECTSKEVQRYKICDVGPATSGERGLIQNPKLVMVC